MLGENTLDHRLIGFGGCCSEGEREFIKTKLEQAIAVT
jgi:hypothetical protein